MRFRAIFFGIFFMLSLLWICYGFYATSTAFVEVVGTPAPNSTTQSQAARDMRNARTAGATIGAGLGLGIFLCTGVPLALFFGLLSWRNNVGLRSERRHQEMMDVHRQQAHAMQVGATAQMMQARDVRQTSNVRLPAPQRAASGQHPLEASTLREQLREAWQMLKDGDTDGARKLTGQLYKAHPESADVLYMVSFVAESPEKQIKALQRALVLDPNHDRARQRLAKLVSDEDLL
jgi:hypothetical protein